MGSVEGYSKGTTPFLDRIRQHNAEYNAQQIIRAMSCPWWRRVLLQLGFRRQYDRWFYRGWPPSHVSVQTKASSHARRENQVARAEDNRGEGIS